MISEASDNGKPTLCKRKFYGSHDYFCFLLIVIPFDEPLFFLFTHIFAILKRAFEIFIIVNFMIESSFLHNNRLYFYMLLINEFLSYSDNTLASRQKIAKEKKALPPSYLFCQIQCDSIIHICK